MKHTLTLAAIVLLSSSAIAQPKFRDSTPSEIEADGYYDTLAIQCGAITLDQSAHIFALLTRDQQSFAPGRANEIFGPGASGGERAQADVTRNRAAACAKLTPLVMKRVNGLASGDLSVLRRAEHGQ